MKLLSYLIIPFFLLPSVFAKGQSFSGNSNLHVIAKDSVIVSLNKDYYFVKDSCAQIARYTRLDFQHKKFIGKFKDLSVNDSTRVLSSGNYNQSGLKQGEFICYYPNGQLHSKGRFDNNKLSGRWEVYGENGKQHLTFSADSNGINIIDYWDYKGKRTVVNGNGKATIDVSEFFCCSGAFVNGKRNAVWKMTPIADDSNELSNLSLTEYFENGRFIKGENKAFAYTDSSHMVLIDPRAFPYIIAEKFKFSFMSCSTINANATNAEYKSGAVVLKKLVGNIVDDYIQDYFKDKQYLAYYQCFMTIQGEIDEKGRLIHLSTTDKKPFAQNEMIQELAGLFPKLIPATLNGKSVRQKIIFTFNFDNGSCQYNYTFLPIDNR